MIGQFAAQYRLYSRLYMSYRRHLTALWTPKPSVNVRCLGSADFACGVGLDGSARWVDELAGGTHMGSRKHQSLDRIRVYKNHYYSSGPCQYLEPQMLL